MLTPPPLLEPVPVLPLLELPVPTPLELLVPPLPEPLGPLPLLLEVPPDEELAGPASPEVATVPPQLDETMEAAKARYATSGRGRIPVRQFGPVVAAAQMGDSKREEASR